jgi:DNA polymerase III sliding clamp (beta) subunit (PCNA family)
MTAKKKPTISIGTSGLVDVLSDVLPAAGNDATLPMIHGIMLHTGKHENGSVLVATATDRFTLAQSWIPAGGEIPQLWIPRDDLKQLLPLLRPFARRKDTTCEIVVDGRDVTFTQNPLPGMPVMSVTIQVEGSGDFPNLERVFPKGEPSNEVTTFDVRRLNVPMQVAKRRGESIRLVSYGATAPAWAYVGQQYRCLVMPMRANDTTVSPWFEVPVTAKRRAAA